MVQVLTRPHLGLLLLILSCLLHLHSVASLENHELANVAVNVQDVAHLKEAVQHILVPRVVGTAGHTQVQDYIKATLTSYGWTVQTDRFDDNTPMGTKTFENIMAYSNPSAEKFLLIAAHYDSKFFASGDFLGATDSAVPCAMMLNLVKTLQAPLGQLKTRSDLGLLLVFFDGEEAFVNWSATDSLYGARHLAQRWEFEGFLKRIQLFVLLDLIGTPDPTFYSYFSASEQPYAKLMDAEQRLIQAGHLIKHGSSGVVRSQARTYFLPNSMNHAYIEDDHIPFLRRGVNVLHLIPSPFPDVWHQMGDNGDCIDYDTVENLNRILRVFVVEYLAVTM